MTSDWLSSTTFPLAILAYFPLHVVFAFVLVHVVPWLLDRYSQRHIPGPFLARFSDIWICYWAAKGKRSERVHEIHLKYGKWVRLAPNHVSIADPEALQIVYGHGNVKSDFYESFLSICPVLFASRFRAEYIWKRKILSDIYSQKSALEFEVHIRANLERFLGQWDRIAQGGRNGLGASGDGEGESGWVGREGRVWFDCLPWYHYLTFDIIGDLAFSSPFGMVVAGKDSAPIPIDNGFAVKNYDYTGQKKFIDIPVLRTSNDAGNFAVTLGVLPIWARPYIRKIPWFAKGKKAQQDLVGLAIAAVSKRLVNPSHRNDLFSKLQTGKDERGNSMGKEELTAELLSQLIAGSNTLSNSLCAITFHLANNPRVQQKLQEEIDEALGVAHDIEDAVTTYGQVQSLPYLKATINEALRIHSTSSMGLPRVVPPGGLNVLGRHFPEGAILSVPSYTIHRDKDVWGDDAEAFRPERWFERDRNIVQKAFNPFSFGPRACVGKKLADMELLVIISSVLRRYEFVLEKPGVPLQTCEGFLRNPLHCCVGMKRRYA